MVRTSRLSAVKLPRWKVTAQRKPRGGSMSATVRAATQDEAESKAAERFAHRVGSGIGWKIEETEQLD